MIRAVDCLFAHSEDQPVHRIHGVRPNGLEVFKARLAEGQRNYLDFSGFAAKSGVVVILPAAEDGMIDAVLGLGSEEGLYPFGALPFALPSGSRWRLVDCDVAQATLGFCLGAYRFGSLKAESLKPALLRRENGCEVAVRIADAIWMARDLVNQPANLLGPAELAKVLLELGERFGAITTIVSDDDVTRDYPTIAAVGRGSDRGPCVATLHWRGHAATDTSPLVSLCGKGVCFDSGGYDLKPSSGMLRMKKDMGGAAAMMGVAALVMSDDLPVRLVLRIGCVENSVSGSAMRPLDVIRTRSGKTVEVGNTDAEGRLVLCDLLAEAAAETPDILIDAATLTGAARTALGPDLPALFCNDADWTRRFLDAGIDQHDPLWPLPLWHGYDSWLDSSVADIASVSSKPQAGAIVAALFLQRFVTGAKAWAHVDVYAWNDQARPGRPEGGEGTAIRALYSALTTQFSN
ncbi:leucyl aminopeptidase family protein [Acidisoma cladoniae]|uniref:leucyl aminopeptidase family protein n=1 Tax=Acidisoma cladoniae TaxID=3040935 RepID=UPI00254D4405|nr:leucyl aminopeptidase family protein [Acidisoma sp. PAMC 29798]